MQVNKTLLESLKKRYYHPCCSCKKLIRMDELEKWRFFLDLIDRCKIRDGIIIRLVVLSRRIRLAHILDITLDDLDFTNNKITIHPITKPYDLDVPLVIMDLIKKYIEQSKGYRKDAPYVFVTSTGKKVTRTRINYSVGHAKNIITELLGTAASFVGVPKYSTYASFINVGYADEIIFK